MDFIFNRRLIPFKILQFSFALKIFFKEFSSYKVTSLFRSHNRTLWRCLAFIEIRKCRDERLILEIMNFQNKLLLFYLKGCNQMTYRKLCIFKVIGRPASLIMLMHPQTVFASWARCQSCECSVSRGFPQK